MTLSLLLSRSKKFTLVFALVPAIFLTACDDGSAPETPSRERAVFAAAWNHRAAKIKGGEKYLLPAAGKDATRILKNMAEACARPLSAEQKKELAALRREAATSFQIYADYREKNLRSGLPRLTDAMSDQEYWLALNAWLGVKSGDKPPDYPTPETARRIIFANSFCAFFLNNKEAIHRKGADTAINNCEELSTGGVYPWLDSLLRDF